MIYYPQIVKWYTISITQLRFYFVLKIPVHFICTSRKEKNFKKTAHVTKRTQFTDPQTCQPCQLCYCAVGDPRPTGLFVSLWCICNLKWHKYGSSTFPIPKEKSPVDISPGHLPLDINPLPTIIKKSIMFWYGGNEGEVQGENALKPHQIHL